MYLVPQQFFQMEFKFFHFDLNRYHSRISYNNLVIIILKAGNCIINAGWKTMTNEKKEPPKKERWSVLEPRSFHLIPCSISGN